VPTQNGIDDNKSILCTIFGYCSELDCGKRLDETCVVIQPRYEEYKALRELPHPLTGWETCFYEGEFLQTDKGYMDEINNDIKLMQPLIRLADVAQTPNLQDNGVSIAYGSYDDCYNVIHRILHHGRGIPCNNCS
jgi:hypothetical protein